MLLLVPALLAGPACEGASPGECVEYAHFPSFYPDARAAEASCKGYEGRWRPQGCPRDPATWLGECRTSTWSKHYYVGVAGGAAIGELCVTAEGGSWFPAGSTSPSEFEYQWATWKKRWDTPRPAGMGAKLTALLASDPLKGFQLAALAHAMFEGFAGTAMEADWQRVRAAAEAAGVDWAPRAAEKEAVIARLHGELDRDLAEAFVAVGPALEGGRIERADAARSDQLGAVEATAIQSLGHLADPAPVCRALAAVAKQRQARGEPQPAAAAAELVRAKCANAGAAVEAVDNLR